MFYQGSGERLYSILEGLILNRTPNLSYNDLPHCGSELVPNVTGTFRLPAATAALKRKCAKHASLPLMMRMMRREQDDKEDDGEVDGAANKSMNSHLHLTKRGSIMQSRRFFVDKSLQFVSAVTAKEPIGSGCTQRFGRHCRLRMAVLYRTGLRVQFIVLDVIHSHG